VAVIAVDRTLPVLAGQHQLEVRTLTLKPESFEVEYTITPPLPASGDEIVFMRIVATDDRGRTYGDNSGDVSSLSEDGLRTVGTAYIQPGFPSKVHEATLHIVFLWGGLETEYDVRVNLGDSTAE
jgi:hypothetical protein